MVDVVVRALAQRTIFFKTAPARVKAPLHSDATRVPILADLPLLQKRERAESTGVVTSTW